MPHLKNILCVLLSALTAAISCSCAVKGDPAAETDQLTYYYVEGVRDDMVEKIQRYNRWCYNHSTTDMQIKLIEFDSFDTMSRRLNLEVMSGGGPDLFSNYMDLPFEKMLQSGAFYDLNKLIENDTSADKIDLSLYNQTIMEAGVYDGKRYFIPAFYRVQSLVGEKQVLEKFKMPTQQGFHLTFDNMEEAFASYLEDPRGYAYMNGDVTTGGFNADTAILRLVNSHVDFKSKTVSFDGEFRQQLQMLSKLREHAKTSPVKTSSSGKGSADQVLFDPAASYSNPIWTEFMMSLPDDERVQEHLNVTPMKEPVMYSCFEKDESTYSANIVDALFVNAETKKSDKVLAFIKYLLGSHIQNLYTGTSEEYRYSGDVDFLPVLNAAFENCVRDSHSAGAWFGVENTELHPITQSLIQHVKSINAVFLYFDLYQSNYNKNIVIPVLQDYWDGKTDINKCVANLSSATKIYIME